MANVLVRAIPEDILALSGPGHRSRRPGQNAGLVHPQRPPRRHRLDATELVQVLPVTAKSPAFVQPIAGVVGSRGDGPLLVTVNEDEVGPPRLLSDELVGEIARVR